MQDQEHTEAEDFVAMLEKELILLKCLLKRMPGEERANVAIKIAYELASYAGRSELEAVGILEKAKAFCNADSWTLADSDMEEEEE